MADFKIFTPDVSQGEISVETVGDAGFDPDPELNGARSYTAEFGYGVTRWWKAEVEFQFDREAASTGATSLARITSENTFQVTAPGQYWVDAGFFVEYAQSVLAGDPNEATLGPLLRKQFWGLTNTVNLFLQKDFGAHATGSCPVRVGVGNPGRCPASAVRRPLHDRAGISILRRAGGDRQRARQSHRPAALRHRRPSRPRRAGVECRLPDRPRRACPRFTPRWEFEYDVEF